MNIPRLAQLNYFKIYNFLFIIKLSTSLAKNDIFPCWFRKKKNVHSFDLYSFLFLVLDESQC